MEQVIPAEVLAEIEARRYHVASWIQNTLQPVDRLMKYDGLFPDGGVDADVKPDIKTPNFEVREYQLDAWGALWDARKAGADRGLIHLATGLGKTSVGVFDAMKFREEFRAVYGRDPKIMFAVHQNDILEQAAERFRTFMSDATVGFYNGNDKNLDGEITFATLQSLYANLDTLDPKIFDYIINDEVHHAKADTYEKVIKHFKPQFRLGLTATPNRTDDKDIRELYGNELYSKGLAEALSEDWLASPDYHIVFDDAVKEVMQSGFQATSLRALHELFSVQPRNDVIAKNIKEEAEKIGLEFGSAKTIVFCQNIERAEEMAGLLGGKAYHSEAHSGDREQIFDEFKNGDLQVITTRDMFNEGVDVPDARLLVFLRSTSSQTIFEQQLGRGLRKAEGKDRVSILDFVANVERIAMIRELATKVTGGDGDRSTKGTDTTVGEGGSVYGGEFDDSQDSFRIHTNHGDFDFDKMTVDLLAKYNDLKTDNTAKYYLLSKEELTQQADDLFGKDTYLSNDALNEASKQDLFAGPYAIRQIFGSSEEFNRFRGFEVKEQMLSSGWDERQIIDRANEFFGTKAVTDSMITQASKQGLMPSAPTVRKVFGNLNNLNLQRGVEVSRRSKFKNLSNEDIISVINELLHETMLDSATLKQLSENGVLPSAGNMRKRFGGIENINAARGIKPHEDTRKEELINLANEIWPNRSMTIAEVDGEDGFVNSKTLAKLFGSFNAFNEARGFAANRERSQFTDNSNEELLALSLNVQPEGNMTKRTIVDLSKQKQFPSDALIIKRFGSVSEFNRQRSIFSK